MFGYAIIERNSSSKKLGVIIFPWHFITYSSNLIFVKSSSAIVLNNPASISIEPADFPKLASRLCNKIMNYIKNDRPTIADDPNSVWLKKREMREARGRGRGRINHFYSFG